MTEHIQTEALRVRTTEREALLRRLLTELTLAVAEDAQARRLPGERAVAAHDALLAAALARAEAERDHYEGVVSDLCVQTTRQRDALRELREHPAVGAIVWPIIDRALSGPEGEG
jgi:predicted RNA-binding Zn ribbon-like protein